MKVIIYFGHHKVGSTALQAYLARNALALLEHGILYPAAESEGLSHLLAQALGRQDRPALGCMNVREPHNALAFRMLAGKTGRKTPPWHGPLPGLAAMLNTLTHQVEVLQPHTVILCSEVFANFGAGHEDLIAKLHGLFPAAEWELYCALRRPDEYMASWFGQRLRFGHQLEPLSSPGSGQTGSIHFNYRRMVEPWVREFEGCQLHLRNYSDILAAGGSVQDFTAQAGCAFPDGLPAGGRSNEGLPRAAYEIIRRANRDLPPEQAQALRDFFLAAPGGLIPVRNSDVELFGAERRQQLADAFAPIHDYLSQLTGRPAFFPGLDEMRSPRPVPEAEATAQILAKLDPAALPAPELSRFISSLQRDL